MTRRILVAMMFLCMFSSFVSFAQETKWVITPFYQLQVMEGESMFFIEEKSGEPAQASLLFTPTKITSVTSATGETVYREGQDYLWLPGTNVIKRTQDSRIPFKTKAEMYPNPESKMSIRAFRGDTTKNLFFSEGRVFHDLQTIITYEHKGEWGGYRPAFAGESLPGTIAKLKSGKPVNVVLFGNSISRGYNASEVVKALPYQPSYGDLVAINLGHAYKTKINFANPSVGGKRTDWGLSSITQVIKENPDLVIIGFGMNDASGRFTPEFYAQNVRMMMDAVRASKPDVEFILIATMTGNSEWTRSSPELYIAYRDALKKLCTNGVALADMTSMWHSLLKVKKFADITGNGVNHPNDFAHRIYASVILGLLVE